MTILIRSLVAVLALVAIGLLIARLVRDDEDRISDGIDAARDALVDGADDAFLAQFHPDAAYRARGGLEELRADLGRWRRSGLRTVHVSERAISVEGDGAQARLRVFVGAGIRGVGVDVALRFRKEGGDWLVTSFDWSR